MRVRSTPWIANLGEGAVEQCPRVGMTPNGRASGAWDQAAWLKPSNRRRTVVVSITEPGRKAKLPKGWHNVLRLGFQDYDSLRRHPESAVLFTPTMAARLARFARKHRGCNFVVHCAAGISRSGGVVEALLEAFPEYEDRGWTRHANGHVKTLLKRALGLVPIGYEEPRPSTVKDVRIQSVQGVETVVAYGPEKPPSA